MKVTILGSGTSQGVPQIACDCKICKSNNPKNRRSRSSILLSTSNTNIVVDTGPDFRMQMLREKVNQLDGVVFTHEHADHLFGLDDVRSFTNQTNKPMTVYAEPRVQKKIKSTFDYIFTSQYAGIAKIDLCTIENIPFSIGDITLQPIRMFHHLLPVYGYRIGNFAYLTDFKTIEDKELEKLKGVKTLVIEALHKKEHISHINLNAALKLIDRIGANQNYLTHMSHRMPNHEELDTMLPDHISPAYDGLTFTV